MIQGEIVVVGRIMQIAVKRGSYRKVDEQTLIADGWELIYSGGVNDDIMFDESYDVFEKELK